MNIRQATITDLDQLSILFAQYRVFYEQPFVQKLYQKPGFTRSGFYNYKLPVA